MIEIIRLPSPVDLSQTKGEAASDVNLENARDLVLKLTQQPSVHSNPNSAIVQTAAETAPNANADVNRNHAQKGLKRVTSVGVESRAKVRRMSNREQGESAKS